MLQTANKNNNPSILLVSVDALKPEFVFEQERLGVNLPTITKYFVENGLTAPDGMKSVFPTFTYPCHQSMITGTNPATHKTYNNGIFDPTGEHLGAWHWFVSTEVKTLWEAAKENGYWSASVAFPTSVGANGDFIAPEFWWDGSSLDSRFIDAVAKPQGIILEMEKEIGQYAGGLDLTDAGDAQRGKAALWMLRNKIAPVISEKPFFMSAYFASFDESAHVNGVYSKEAAAALKTVVDQLLSDPQSGIMEVLTGEEAEKRGGFPEAAYVLVSEKGYELRDDVIGDYCRTTLTQKAQHGYNENFPEMRASFMLTGEGIRKGHIDDVRLIDVAPTLAGLMNFILPDAEGRNLLK